MLLCLSPAPRNDALQGRGNGRYEDAMGHELPSGWTLAADGKALERTYRFKDFAEAFAFLARVAEHAEAVDHHPEFTSVWNRVDFRLTSHDSDGVTERDVALAQVIDRLAGDAGRG